MTELPKVEDLFRIAEAIRSEDGASQGLTFDDLIGEDDWTDEDVASLWLSVQHYHRVIGAVVRAMADEVSERLKNRGTGLEVMGEWVMYQPPKKEVIKDPEGFWQWMKANPEYMEKAFNPNTIRKTGIPQSVFDTFYSREAGGKPVLSSVPTHILEAKKRGRQ